MRVEFRLDGSFAVRFGKRYLSVAECQPSQSGRRTASPKTEASRPTGQEPVDEKLSPDRRNPPCRQSRYPAQRLCGRPRSIDPKTASPKLHQSSLPRKTKTPISGSIGPGLTGGLAPSASEPAPSQRSSDLLRGARLPRNIVFTLNPRPQIPPSAQDISTWQRIGHFCLALTLERNSRGAVESAGDPAGDPYAANDYIAAAPGEGRDCAILLPQPLQHGAMKFAKAARQRLLQLFFFFAQLPLYSPAQPVGRSLARNHRPDDVSDPSRPADRLLPRTA